MTSFLNYRTTRDCSILTQLPAVLQGLSRLASHPPAARGHVHTRHLWASCPLSVRCKANVHGDCSSVKNPIFGCIFSLGLPGENPTVVPTRVGGFVCRKPYHLELLALCLVKNKMLGDRAESFKKAINRICVSSPGITRQRQKLLCMLCWRQHMATLRVRIKQHNLPLAEPAARGLHGRAQTPWLHCSVPWS